MGRTVSEAGFLYGRTAAEMMKSERRVCPVDEEGRFSLTLSDVDNGDHYFRAYMVIDGKTYNGVTGWFEVKVASVPEVTTELSEAAGGVLTLKGSYKLDRDLSVEPGFRYAATADGVASVQFVRATQVDEANKTFSLDIPDTGQPCFFQAVVRMSTDFYDGEVSEVIRPKDLSATGVANCYIVTEGGWYSIEPKRPDGTAVQGSAADWVWSSGSGLVSGVHFSAGRIVFQTSGNAGNAGIALTNDAGEIVWSWHIWMAQAPAEQTVNGRTFLDRNVGATEFDGALVGSLGVYFQWGRKDPFIGANRIQKNYTDEYEGVGFQTTGDNGFTALFLYNDALCEGFKFVNKEMDMSMSISQSDRFLRGLQLRRLERLQQRGRRLLGRRERHKDQQRPVSGRLPRTDVRRNQRVYQGHRHEQDRAGKRQRPVVRTQIHRRRPNVHVPGLGPARMERQDALPGARNVLLVFNYFADNGKESPRLL